MDDFYFEDDLSQDDGSLDIQRYWSAIVNKWWLWSLITLLIAAPWVYYVKNEQPVYEATAVIQFRNYEGIDWGLSQERSQRLMSRSFAEQIVEELGLTMTILPGEDGSILSRKAVFENFSSTFAPVTGVYMLRFPGDGAFSLYWKESLDEKELQEKKIYSGYVHEAQADTVRVNGIEFLLARATQTFPSEVVFQVNNFRKTVKDFQQRIQVDYGGRGTLMEIKLQDNDPYLAALMTNRLAEIYVRESASLKDEVSQSQLQILKAQMEQARKEYELTNQELRKFRSKNALDLDNVAAQQGVALANAEEEKEQLTRQKDVINIMLDQTSEFKSNGAAKLSGQKFRERRSLYREFVRLPVFSDTPRMIVAKTRLEEAEARYDKAAKLSEENPTALKMAEELQQIHLEIERIARQKVREIDMQIAKVQREIRSLQAKLAQLPAKQIEYTDLIRKNQQYAKIYQDQLNKYQQAQLSTVTETEEIRILDPAIEPERPINSSKKVRAGLGVIGGFMAGVFLTLLLEILNKTVRSPDDVKKYLKLNVLGLIPEVNFESVYDFQDQEKIKMIDQQLVTHDYSPTPIGEAYRSLRTNIMFSKNVGRIQSLVITSMAPGDGKSFTSANLAITMAQQKSNTLLIDTDLRRGVLHNTFGVAKEPGFSNYLTNNARIPEIVNETHIPNLSIIACGSLIPNPSELLGSHQMRRFLDEIRRRFDLIIFDTPPLNAATDAVVIGTQVDGTLIVIRAGKTNRDFARQKLELYNHVPAKVIGVVLNGATAELAHEGYSYYHY